MAPRRLCYSSFAVLHSGKSHTPIYVASFLKNMRMAALDSGHSSLSVDRLNPHPKRPVTGLGLTLFRRSQAQRGDNC